MSNEKKKRTRKVDPYTRFVHVDLKRIREEYGAEIAEEYAKLYREMITLKSKLDELMKSSRVAWAENKILRQEVEALRKEKEILEVNLERLRSMYEEKVRQANVLKLEIEDLKLRSAIAESSYVTLIEYITAMKRKMAELMAEGAPEIIRREMEAGLAFLIEQINQVLNTLRGGMIAPAVIEETGKKS